MNTTLQAALSYLERGWSIVPLLPREKRPALRWTEFQERRPTREEVGQWWGRHPDWGLALVCGAVSGVVVVDIDPRNGGSLGSLPDLPPCPKVETGGGGHHLYFATNGQSIPSGILAPGVEFQGEGKLAVLPPSRHPSGRAYRWLVSPNGSLPTLPQEIVALLRKKGSTPPGEARPPSGDRLGLGGGRERRGVGGGFNLAEALAVRPGSAIPCPCGGHKNGDRTPSLGVWEDEAYCFTTQRRFSPRTVLSLLGRPIPPEAKPLPAPKGRRFDLEKATLLETLRELARETFWGEEGGARVMASRIGECGRMVRQKKQGQYLAYVCGTCGIKVLRGNWCESRFCPYCSERKGREKLKQLWEKAAGLPLKVVRVAKSEIPPSGLSTWRKGTLGKLKKAPILAWAIPLKASEGKLWGELVVLSVGDVEGEDLLPGAMWNYALTFFQELVCRPPSFDSTQDLACLLIEAKREPLSGFRGVARSGKKKEPKAPRLWCPVCGGTSLRGHYFSAEVWEPRLLEGEFGREYILVPKAPPSGGLGRSGPPSQGTDGGESHEGLEIVRRARGNVRCDLCGDPIGEGEYYASRQWPPGPGLPYEERAVVCEECEPFRPL